MRNVQKEAQCRQLLLRLKVVGVILLLLAN